MFYLIRECEEGRYQDKAGVKYDVIEGQFIFAPGKEVNEDCEEFENMEECLAAHELTDLDPDHLMPDHEHPLPTED